MSRQSRSSHSNPKRKRVDAAAPGNRTLGMAWGANSLSAASGSKRSAAFSGFGSYMSEKERKLGLQFQSDVENSLASEGKSSTSAAPKGLFSGISIFVDGYTIPSNQELRSCMIRYGGRYENYFSKSKVTHIVCSNLPESKVKNLRSFSRGLPVVKPQWILDSIAANKILPVASYQLDRIANDCPQQRRLSAFFGAKASIQNPKEFKEDSSNHLLCLQEYSNAQVFETGDCVSSMILSTDTRNLGASDSRVEVSCNNDSTVAEDCNPQILSTSDFKDNFLLDNSGACNENKSIKADPALACNSASNDAFGNMTSKTSHSTLGDTNFVENYFKNSRLHFIGTWKNRYRKRYAGKSVKSDRDAVSEHKASSCHNARAVAHIDMDCFFVAVVVRDRPDLEGKPVAVCHSDNSKGTAEISSANYPARTYGIKAGMFVRDAKLLCPDLSIVPYNFEAYQEVADLFYDILHKYCSKVQALSCDEAYLDLTGIEDPNGIIMAMRREIFDVTRCTASAGIAENLLLARMATSCAKPNGQYYVQPDEVEHFLDQLSVSELPGVGYALQEKLNSENIYNCKQLQAVSKDTLQRQYGYKTGELLWSYCRGIDNREIQDSQDLKSVGAEVNWGVRFNTLDEVHHFMLKLSKEVSARLQDASVKGRTITLKVKKRKRGAGEPIKFMGCGVCDNLSHSVTILSATDECDTLFKISWQIFSSFNLDVKEVRGVGLQVSRLQDADACHLGNEKNALRKWLSSAPKDVSNQSVSTKDGDSGQKSVGSSKGCDHAIHAKEKLVESHLLPRMSQLDASVLASLPAEILSEIRNAYQMRPPDFVSESNSERILHRDSNVDIMKASSSGTSGLSLSINSKWDEFVQKCKGKAGRSSADKKFKEGKEFKQLKEQDLGHLTGVDKDCTICLPPSSELDISVLSALPSPLRLQIEKQYEQSSDSLKHKYVAREMAETATSHVQIDKRAKGSTTRPHACMETDTSRNKAVEQESKEEESTSLTLSQVDMNVLNELPADIQREILNNIISEPGGALQRVNQISEKLPQGDSLPIWVQGFESSSARSLKLLSDWYCKQDCPRQLSSILLSIVSLSPEELAAEDVDEKMLNGFSEFLKQYINERIKNDIEEIYTCFRLLKRLLKKSKFWDFVYHSVIPFLQGHVSSIYGGVLKL